MPLQVGDTFPNWDTTPKKATMPADEARLIGDGNLIVERLFDFYPLKIVSLSLYNSSLDLSLFNHKKTPPPSSSPLSFISLPTMSDDEHHEHNFEEVSTKSIIFFAFFGYALYGPTLRSLGFFPLWYFFRDLDLSRYEGIWIVGLGGKRGR